MEGEVEEVEEVRGRLEQLGEGCCRWVQERAETWWAAGSTEGGGKVLTLEEEGELRVTERTVMVTCCAWIITLPCEHAFGEVFYVQLQ